MDSKEFGLVAAQQLFQVEDLHYGFWNLDDKINLSNWKIAQERHTDFLFKYIEDNIQNKKLNAMKSKIKSNYGSWDSEISPQKIVEGGLKFSEIRTLFENFIFQDFSAF